MDTKTFTRQQLYELVWQRPLRDIAGNLGISDVALGNACRRHSIPLPGKGYWAKINAGQQLTRIPLAPAAGAPVRSQISFTATLPKAPVVLPPKHERSYIDQPFILSTLTAPHPLTKRIRRLLQRQEVDKFGLRTAALSNSLSLCVSPAIEHRALIILDTLLLRLKKAGAKAEEKPTERYGIEPSWAFVLDNEELHLTIREPYRQRRKTDDELETERRAGTQSPTTYAYTLSQRLTLCIENFPQGYEASWSDRAVKVEQRLPAVLKALLALPDVLKEQRRLAREADARRFEEQQRQYQVQQQLQRRKRYLADLISEAERFQQHQQLTHYLDEVERRAALRGCQTTSAFRNSMALARQLAEELLLAEQRIDQFAAPSLTAESLGLDSNPTDWTGVNSP